MSLYFGSLKMLDISAEYIHPDSYPYSNLNSLAQMNCTLQENSESLQADVKILELTLDQTPIKKVYAKRLFTFSDKTLCFICNRKKNNTLEWVLYAWSNDIIDDPEKGLEAYKTFRQNYLDGNNEATWGNYECDQVCLSLGTGDTGYLSSTNSLYFMIAFGRVTKNIYYCKQSDKSNTTPETTIKYYCYYALEGSKNKSALRHDKTVYPTDPDLTAGQLLCHSTSTSSFTGDTIQHKYDTSGTLKEVKLNLNDMSPYESELDIEIWGNCFTSQPSIGANEEGSKSDISYDGLGDNHNVTEDNGSNNYTSDPLPIPSMPELTSKGTGMIEIYTPTQQQMTQLKNAMLNPSFLESSLHSLYGNPFDGIISFGIMPVNPQTGDTVIAHDFKVLQYNTNIMINVPSSQFITKNLGSIELNFLKNNFLDFSPHTKISIYLPFIGMRELDTDDVMHKTISLYYKFDLSNGVCIAYITINDSLRYQFSGQCLESIPLDSINSCSQLNTMMSLVSSGVALFSGGNQAVMNASNIAHSFISTLGSKPNVSHHGNLSGNLGTLSCRTPYLQIKTPKQEIVDQYNNINGRPSVIRCKLSAISGFTKVKEMQWSNISATCEEIEEIDQLLKEGVYL